MRSEYDALGQFLTAELRAAYFVLTASHLDEYLARLDPSRFSEVELRGNYLNVTSEPNAGPPMLDGIRPIGESLKSIGGQDVVVLSIA